MNKQQKILPEYEESIKKGIADADNYFPDVKDFIKEIKIGNAGLNGESDGTRLGKCNNLTYGLCEITLSEKILSEKHPDRNMDEEIRSTIVHEYAHASQSVYAYKKAPMLMYLSLITQGHRKVERRYIEEFAEKYEKTDFGLYIWIKRIGEDIASELISEAYESVYCNDEYAEEAKIIVMEYEQVIKSKPLIPIVIFRNLLLIRSNPKAMGLILMITILIGIKFLFP